MNKTIFFDMDGTIANLYAIDNWLNKLRNYDASPYVDAVPMLNMSLLARFLNKLQRKGYKLGIISWLSKEPTPDYDLQVIHAKEEWLNKHLTSVSWDVKFFVPYGTPKSLFLNNEEDILFDDEARNRAEWTGMAYEPSQIMEILKIC